MSGIPAEGHEGVKPEGPAGHFLGRGQILLALLLTITILALYWPVFKYPYIQDDWLILHRLAFSSTSEFFARAFSPLDRVFYRPAGDTVFFVIHSIFGTNPTGFHLVGLFLHVCTSLLLMRLVSRLVANPVIGWGAGWLYASSATVHLEPLLWLVGMYELIAGLSVVGSLLAFLKGRHLISSGLLLGGLLAKEASIVTFPILVLLVLCRVPAGTLYRLKQLLPHTIVISAYVVLKLLGTSPLQLPADHPYAVQITGGHVRANLISYAAWAAEALIPVKVLDHSGQLANYHVVGLTALLLASFILVALGRNRTDQSRLFVFLAGWSTIGILPVLFLPNQLYKYYLTYSLMPLAILVVLLIVGAGKSFRWMQRLISICIGVVCLASVAGSMVYVLEKDSMGYQEGKTSHSRGGENHLVRKGSIVLSVQKTLASLRPKPASGSVFVFTGLDTRVFGDHAGPQIWFGDTTLRVCESDGAGIVDGGMVVRDRGHGAFVLPIDRLNLFAFSEGVLRKIPLSEIPVQRNKDGMVEGGQ